MIGSKQQKFIERIAPYAIEDMKQSKILASLTIAQAILESGWGSSDLTVRGNNLFGIKGYYRNESVIMRTTEYEGGRKISVDARFRKYPSWLESINDHSSMFNRMIRYKNLVGCKDYVKACHNVKQDGYATDPDYTSKLVKLIVNFDLDKYDIMEDELMNKTPVKIMNKDENKESVIPNSYLINDVNYVGLRDILQTLGYEVGWENGKVVYRKVK
jgi:flagellum-specific peptidoglycan hydrolase FlgJ